VTLLWGSETDVQVQVTSGEDTDITVGHARLVMEGGVDSIVTDGAMDASYKQKILV
jgi:hypothetical protein